MLRTRSDSANTSRGIRYRSDPRLLEILVITYKMDLLLLILSLVTCALTKYGERSLEETNAKCKDRSRQKIGFEGDSDFYGLGIRLGLYLQWTSSFITNCFTPTEREPVIVTYIIFSLSITIAVPARIFSQQCTFVAEIFVVLTMFWGGLNILLVPMLRGMTLDRLAKVPIRDTYAAMFEKFQGFQGLKGTASLLNFFMSPITMFFFARIQGHSIKRLSIFMAIASAFNFLWFNLIVLPLRMDPGLENISLESMVGGAIWLFLITLLFPLWCFYELVSTLWSFLVVTLALIFRILLHMIVRRCNFRDAINSIPTKPLINSIPAGPSINSSQGLRIEATQMIRYETGLPMLVSVWCIIGIELTLRWNSVTEVYGINSTGQVIPFVTGLGVFLVSLWKPTKRLIPSDNRLVANGDVELGTHHEQCENVSALGDTERSDHTQHDHTQHDHMQHDYTGRDHTQQDHMQHDHTQHDLSRRHTS